MFKSISRTKIANFLAKIYHFPRDNNKKAENAAAEEHRNRAVERLGETKKRNAEKQDEQAQTAKEEDRH